LAPLSAQAETRATISRGEKVKTGFMEDVLSEFHERGEEGEGVNR
jgi:hypothetical protein